MIPISFFRSQNYAYSFNLANCLFVLWQPAHCFRQYMQPLPAYSDYYPYFWGNIKLYTDINMYLKASLAYRPASRQLLVLLLLVLAGSIFSSLLGMCIFWLVFGFKSQPSGSPDAMRLLQFVSALGTFLLPSLGMAYLCSDNSREYLLIKKKTTFFPYLLVVVSMFLLMPTISLTALLNEQMRLPGALKVIEDWMRVQEDLGTKLTNLLVFGGGVMPLASNFVVVALTAAVAEEFLFRGTLCRTLGRFGLGHHAVIWLSAIMFSAFHLQFYGFIPRLLLGAYFGYLLYWGRNIWLPVLAHFTNNAVALLGMSVPSLRNNEFLTGEVGDENIRAYTVMGLVFLVLFFFLIKRLRLLLEEQY